MMTRYQDFNFDTILIRHFTKYRDIDIVFFESDKYVNLIQAYEQDKNIEQDGMLYIGTKMCQ